MASQQACTLTFFMLSLLAIWGSPSVLCVLVPSTPFNLQYHKGALLAGDGPIKLHLTFYGEFTSLEKDTIKTFLYSLSGDASPSYLTQFSSKLKNAPLKSTRKLSGPELKPLSVMKRVSSEGDSRVPSPTVAQWWSLTRAYTDLRGNSISQTVLIEHEASDDYSYGKLLSHSHLASLAKSSARRSAAARSLSHGAEDDFNVHLIFTAADVAVEGFCMHACGRHSHTHSDGEVVYAWVGNPRDQCPGYCAWPFVRTEYGPDMRPLKAPNMASADAMIITLAKVLVEAATNPFGDGYHVGGGSHGVGAGGICAGKYGDDAFPGYPGHTLREPRTGASYNVKGQKQLKFLLPHIWNPLTLSCAGQP